MKTKILFLLLLITVAIYAKDPFGPDPYGNNNGVEKSLGCELRGGKLYITWEKTTLYFFPEGVQNSRRLWKDVYCASNGVIVLEKQIMASYHAATSTPESIEWPTNQ